MKQLGDLVIEDSGDRQAIRVLQAARPVVERQSLQLIPTASAQQESPIDYTEEENNSILDALRSIDSHITDLADDIRKSNTVERHEEKKEEIRKVEREKKSQTAMQKVLERTAQATNSRTVERIAGGEKITDVLKDSLNIEKIFTAGIGEFNSPIMDKIGSVLVDKVKEAGKTIVSRREDTNIEESTNETTNTSNNEISTLQATRIVSEAAREGTRDGVMEAVRDENGVFQVQPVSSDENNDKVRDDQMAEDIHIHRMDDSEGHKELMVELNEISNTLATISETSQTIGGNSGMDLDVDTDRRRRRGRRMRGRNRLRARPRMRTSRIGRGGIRAAASRATPLLSRGVQMGGAMLTQAMPAASGLLGSSAASTVGSGLLRLSLPATALAAAGYGGWKIGGLLNDGINSIIEKVTGEEGATLGTKLYDVLHDDKGRNKIGLWWDRLWGNAPSEEEEKRIEAERIQTMKETASTEKTVEVNNNAAGIDSTKNDLQIGRETDSTKNDLQIERETDSEMRQLEESASIMEQNTAQPIIIQSESPQPKKDATPIIPGRGQDNVPILTRSADTALSRITDNMMLASI